MSDIEEQTPAQQPVAGPSSVLYCGVCGFPPEYCEFGAHLTKCKIWLQDEHSELYDKYYSEEALAAKVGTLSLEKQAKLEKDVAKAEAKAEAKAANEDKKRSAAKVIIKRVERQKRKYDTRISGLEQFGVDLKKAAKALAQRFATSASVSKNPQGQDEIVVAGDVADDVLDIIEETGAVFKGIPEDVCEIVEDKKKKAAD
ncbi:density-regulated protein DRP1 [Auricularia subglabra TFB-10046 SS5]|nr:density-regulated protein DRP1 [Auricularia subglabra TFB-10046 SS5]